MIKIFTFVAAIFCANFSLGSDHVTLKQQNSEMARAFEALPLNLREGSNACEPKVHSEILQQVFGHGNLSPIREGQALVTAELEDGTLVDAFSLEQFNEAFRLGSETMMHRFNDTINFLLTTQGAIASALDKNPRSLRASYWPTLSPDDDFEFVTPLTMFDSNPLMETAHGMLTVVRLQYWIDYVGLVKNFVFPDGKLGSYNTHAAMMAGEFLNHAIARLGHSPKPAKPIDVMQGLMSSYSQEEQFIARLVNYFEEPLKINFEAILQAVPEQGGIKYFNSHEKISGAMKIKIETDRVARMSRFCEGCLEQIRVPYDGYFEVLLKTIMSKSLKEVAAACNRHGLIGHPGFSGLLPSIGQCSDAQEFQDFIGDLKIYDIKLRKFRKQLKLTSPLFANLSVGAVLNKALGLHNGIMRGCVSQLCGLPKSMSVGTEMSITQPPVLFIEGLTDDDDDDDADSDSSFADWQRFDESYFKNEHSAQQSRKAKTVVTENQATKLSDYEIRLFTFLLENIYHPSTKLSWRALVAELANLGFLGTPNDTGNGSTWAFTLTEKSEYFSLPGAQLMRFSVHEYNGNGPVNRAYYRFFKSGFSNVFNLSKEIIEARLK